MDARKRAYGDMRATWIPPFPAGIAHPRLRRFAEQRQTDKQSFGPGCGAVNDVARKSLRPMNVANHYSLRVGL
jgi:hypothetical protein